MDRPVVFDEFNSL